MAELIVGGIIGIAGVAIGFIWGIIYAVEKKIPADVLTERAMTTQRITETQQRIIDIQKLIADAAREILERLKKITCILEETALELKKISAALNERKDISKDAADIGRKSCEEFKRLYEKTMAERGELG